MSANFRINVAEVERLQTAMKEYQGNAEDAINDALHNEAGDLIQEQVKRLMPVSGKSWRGKKPAAKTSQSLQGIPANLAITVTTKKNYQYLYFPDDGTNTRRHVGNQQFFARGGEAATADIVDRCVAKLINKFENEV